MADIKLKDRNDNETTYTGVSKLKVPAADGGEDVVFQLPPTLQKKTVSVTENGTMEITPDKGIDALSAVALTVNVPSSGAIPDWTQNDETAADYVKNRPGGYDVYSTELAATGSFAPESSEFGYAAVDFPVKFIVDGQKVTVKIENETFERTVQKIPDDQKINKNNLAEYWIRRTEGENIGDNELTFIFQLQSEGTWEKGTLVSGTYLGKAFEVYAEVATPVKFPAKYVDTKFIVTATASSDNTCTADHTVAEVFAAYNAGMIVECHITVGQFVAILPLVWPSEAIVGFGATISADKLGMGFNVNSISVFGINTGSNEAWTMYTNLFCEKGDVRQVPEYSSADNGKFLRVVNGDPAWETVSDTTIKLRSSTAGSAKYFNITVNDSGQITATEAT